MVYHRMFDFAFRRLHAAVWEAKNRPTPWAKVTLQRERERTAKIMRLLEMWVIAELQRIAPNLVHDGVLDTDYLDTIELHGFGEASSALNLAYLWLNIRTAIIEYLPEHDYLIVGTFNPERIAQEYRALVCAVERREIVIPYPTLLKLTPTTKPNAPNAAA